MLNVETDVLRRVPLDFPAVGRVVVRMPSGRRVLEG